MIHCCTFYVISDLNYFRKIHAYVISFVFSICIGYAVWISNLRNFQFSFRAWINFESHTSFIWLHLNRMHQCWSHSRIIYWWNLNGVSCVCINYGWNFFLFKFSLAFAFTISSQYEWAKKNIFNLFQFAMNPPITGYCCFGIVKIS